MQALLERYDTRIMDRVREMTVMRAVKGDSFRGTINQRNEATWQAHLKARGGVR